MFICSWPTRKPSLRSKCKKFGGSGHSKVETYDPTRGARYYVTKSIGSPLYEVHYDVRDLEIF